MSDVLERNNGRFHLFTQRELSVREQLGQQRVIIQSPSKFVKDEMNEFYGIYKVHDYNSRVVRHWVFPFHNQSKDHLSKSYRNLGRFYLKAIYKMISRKGQPGQELEDPIDRGFRQVNLIEWAAKITGFDPYEIIDNMPILQCSHLR